MNKTERCVGYYLDEKTLILLSAPIRLRLRTARC